MQAYSTWHASVTLDRLEALRTGDRSADLEKAVRGCEMENTSSGKIYFLSAGAFRLQGIWKLVWKLPDKWAYGLEQMANRAALRYWYLNISSSAEQGHITEVLANLYLVGRYEALGTKWQIAPSIPSHYVREGLTPVDRRTYMGWFHITSMPSGEGFGI